LSTPRFAQREFSQLDLDKTLHIGLQDQICIRLRGAGPAPTPMRLGAHCSAFHILDLPDHISFHTWRLTIEVDNYEDDLSTQQLEEKTDPWISGSHGDQEWPSGHKETQGQGKKAACSLASRKVAVRMSLL
jgi:hypothetical protein